MKSIFLKASVFTIALTFLSVAHISTVDAKRLGNGNNAGRSSSAPVQKQAQPPAQQKAAPQAQQAAAPQAAAPAAARRRHPRRRGAHPPDLGPLLVGDGAEARGRDPARHPARGACE